MSPLPGYTIFGRGVAHMRKRVVVCGGKDFADMDLCFRTLDELLPKDSEVEIISGRAKGADTFGEEYARSHSMELAVFPAEWSKYGRAAGPIRNRQMIEYAQQEDALVIAFWNGQSCGTRNTIDFARKAGVEVCVIRY